MHLFTYGTLMDAAVWSRVAQEKCESRRAVLHGYEARKLRGVTFPGLVACGGAVTPGLVYFDVSAAAMARLDAYEDDFYGRVPVPVVLEDGSELITDVYLMLPACRDVVLTERWEPPVSSSASWHFASGDAE